MNETFASVLLFHAALKNFFVETVGMTVERVLGEQDTILTNDAGTFLRLQRRVNGSVVSVGIEIGDNADMLELSTKDPELWFPFDTSEGGIFQGEARWNSAALQAELIILAAGDRWSKRYRATILFITPQQALLVHQDHLNQTTEPNFKERGGTYIQAGV
jgi:hypothetical protein